MAYSFYCSQLPCIFNGVGGFAKMVTEPQGEKGEGVGKLLFDPEVGELASLIRPVLEYNVVHVQGIKT